MITTSPNDSNKYEILESKRHYPIIEKYFLSLMCIKIYMQIPYLYKQERIEKHIGSRLLTKRTQISTYLCSVLDLSGHAAIV